MALRIRKARATPTRSSASATAYAQGAAGGTGIAIYNGGLYAEQNDKIIRYPLPAGSIVPKGQPRSSFPACRSPATIRCILSSSTRKGDSIVDLGSATNACQISESHPELARYTSPAASWKRAPAHGATTPTRTTSISRPPSAIATGLRNGEGFAFDAPGRIFVTQHGRDQLSENWPKLYHPRAKRRTAGRGNRALKQGADYGWPECYFDISQNKLVLAPEYGGDGGKKVGVCAEKTAPVAALPGALGAERSPDLRRQGFPGGLSRRRLHRLSRLLESRTRAAGRL